MPIFSKIKDFFGNSNHSFAKLVLAFSSARLLRFCFCFVFLGASFFSNSGLQAQQVALNVSQDQHSASSQVEGNALDSSSFYPIPKEPEKDQEATAVFLKSVTEHIIQNRGIQNFYLLSLISHALLWGFAVGMMVMVGFYALGQAFSPPVRQG